MRSTDDRRSFVGRERELRILWERLEEARSGRGGLVLLRGDPGVGKTRLARELADRAALDGVRVFWGRAYDTEDAPPYLPIAEAFAACVKQVPEEELVRALGDGAADVALIAPSVRKYVPGLALRRKTEPGEDRQRLFESVSGGLIELARASGGGVLLVLDDLHWADQATCQLAAHLARKLSDVPLLVVGTYRTVDLNHSAALLDVLADLSREGGAEPFKLGPLSLDDTAALVEQCLGKAAPPVAIEALYRKTDGNAFFAQEVLRELLAEGYEPGSLESGLAALRVPEGVRYVIRKRLAALSPTVNRLLDACTVLGDGVDFEVLRVVCEGDEEALLDGLDQAVAAGLVREEGEGLHLAHALVRQTIGETLTTPRRQRLHLRAAEAIERIHAGNLDSFLGSLTRHYRLAGAATAENALNYAERAAEVAVSVFAYEEAARQLESVVALLDGRLGDVWLQRRAALLQRLGELLFGCGLDWAKGASCLEQALTFYEQLGRTTEAAFVHARLGHYRSAQSTANIPAALTHLRSAEAALVQEPPSPAQGFLYHALAVAAHAGLRVPEGMAASQRVLEIAEAISSDELRARGAQVHGHLMAASGQLAAQGLDQMERGREIAARQNLLYVFHLHSAGGLYLLALRSPREAQTWLKRSCGELDRRQAPPALREVPLGRLGEAAVLAGKLSEARRIFDALEKRPDPRPSQLVAARVALCDGEWKQAESLALQIREACSRIGERRAEWRALDLLARVLQAQGCIGQAELVLGEALAMALDGGHVVFEIAARVELAIFAAQAGQPNEMEAHIARCRSVFAGGEDWRSLPGRVELAGAITLARMGRLSESDSSFRRALETFRSHAAIWDEAETLQLWADALGSAGERGTAMEKLAGARAIYQNIGAGPTWLDSIGNLERRIAQDRRAVFAYPDGLTAREAEVLRLVASGESNREIATRLVLSPRTVERHVASVYGKIGAHRRADAVSYALRQGLSPALAGQLG